MRTIPLNPGHPATGPTGWVFVEGTIFKPESWWTLFVHQRYLPIGRAKEIIRCWQQQGARIVYCTSRKERQADDIAALLKKYGFTSAFLVARERGETYRYLVEAIRPAVLVEDDCKSIGGAWQMCITKVKPEIKEKIVSVVVPEFKGIDCLPTNIGQLQKL